MSTIARIAAVVLVIGGVGADCGNINCDPHKTVCEFGSGGAICGGTAQLPQGGCSYRCTSGNCDFGCYGGACKIECGQGTTCRADCHNGGCIMECAGAKSCKLDCAAVTARLGAPRRSHAC